MFLLTLTFIALEIYRCSADDYQLHTIAGSNLLNASTECLKVFTENVTCSNGIGELYANPFYDPGDAELATICSSECFESLTSHRDRVKSTCEGSQYYDEFENTYWLATSPDEFILYAYNMACMKRRFVSLPHH